MSESERWWRGFVAGLFIGAMGGGICVAAMIYLLMIWGA